MGKWIRGGRDKQRRCKRCKGFGRVMLDGGRKVQCPGCFGSGRK